MRILNLRVRGYKNLAPIVKVDGNLVKLKKNKFGSYSIDYETDKDKVEVSIYKYLEISGRLWWLFTPLFFIISIFGLLDPVRDGKPVIVDSKFVIDMTSSENRKLDLVLDRFTEESGKAFAIEGDLSVEEISNVYFVDPVIKRRQNIMRVVKVLLAVGTAVLVGLLLSK